MRHALLAIAAFGLAACQPQDPDGKRAEAPANADEIAVAADTLADAADEAAEAAEDAADRAEQLAEAAAPKEFGGDINASGTEPFWGLEIRPSGLKFTRPEPEAAITAPNPGVQEAGAEAVWSSTTSDGKAFIVTLVNEGSCSDGMSDLKYPYMAVVTLGSLTYRGCAYKTSARPEGAG